MYPLLELYSTTMNTHSQYSQLLLILLLAVLQPVVGAAADEHDRIEADAQPLMARRSCREKCGDMSIPFPFGMEKTDCFLPGFEVTCNFSFDPPRAFLAYDDKGGSTNQTYQVIYQSGFKSNGEGIDLGKSLRPVELFNISLEKSEVRVYGAINSRCFSNFTQDLLKGKYMVLDTEGPFLLSSTRNALIGVGWNVQPLMSDNFESTTGYSFTLSCTSYLAISLEMATNGSCTGLGCCQVALPKQRLPVTITGISFKDEKSNPRWATNPCSYGMAVEKSWYNFSTEDIYGYEVLSNKLSRGFPLVLDFAIRNGSCQDGGCLSGNSSCANAKNGPGYSCKCWDFYHGNPYITGGCQDIDECQLRDQNPELLDFYPCSTDGICNNRLGGYDCPCKRGMKGDGKKGNCTEIFPLAAKIVVGLASLIVAFVLMVMTKQHLKLRKFYGQNGGPVLNGVKNIRIYTRKQLKQITNNYERVIGEGHFGKVYMGTLKDKQQVAVKKSIKVDKEMKREFTDEVIIQSAMRHKNIAMLIGCCLEMDVPMLVYEFVARGSLYDVLFKGRDSIPANRRLDIAIGSAEGLTYMHSAVESTIRHGDVKSANILLDEYFTPKVSDFGTSKLLAKGKSETAERVVGDKSYIDPVYMEMGILTQKSDVYGFGIVLIELVTRRAATYDNNRSYVANFVQACLDKRARNFIDNDITSEVDLKLLEMVSGVAVECLKPNPEERPDMKQVEHRLLEIVGEALQSGQGRNYQPDLSPAPDDVALLKA
ncbi:wall-associated receptor kinase 3 [Brachypodium distachyon]|uniref:Protein kinase domain-containing protein n=1 Tax=Brachypodium distachyon TaxID=15368 RepID=A0A0Q3I6V7_BRADI|nr:wall-associated receptor kinase 3 [Brachypodium distachyon]KQJ81784.2 hypothetical protein BRADI_5g03070v3 [Brachypodium distachyon]|eukprot:XP_003581027.2 wall-associated receptor kinase 3 [Brachypodium distachyon]